MEMITAPRQNWAMYEALAREENAQWIRRMSPQERFAIYEDLFNVIWNARRDPQEAERLERWRWEQKLALRLRAVEAFSKLDQIRRERAAANNAD
jgi:hypothetical protein